MGKRARLADVIRFCEVRFDRGNALHWKNGDFMDLSREMLRDTNTNISPSTLKRIFGKIAVDDDYVPQQATIDALIQYGRYTELKNIQPDPPPTLAPQLVAPLTVPPEPLNKAGKRNRYNLILIVGIAFIGLASFLTWRLLKPKNIAGTIQLARTEGQLPATAFFELQLPETEDSLFVNFGDKTPLVYLPAGEKRAAHIYYIPGVFTVSVQTRQQPIAITSAYVRSNDWVGLVFHNQQEIPDHFYKFPAVKNGPDSLFQVTNGQLAAMGLDTTGVVLTRLCNYTPTAYRSEDFAFEATFKNTLSDKDNYCRGTQFQIAGSHGMIRFKLVSPGCSLRVINFVSEQTFNGATTDLSPFVQDLGQWNTVKIVNRHQQVSLQVNGKQIFNGTYQCPLGAIKGVFLEFEGTGLVKSCTLSAPDGKVLYHF